MLVLQTATMTLLLSSLLNMVHAANGERGSTAFPYQHPCVSADKMYYEDSSFVYDDLQDGRFSRLYIKFHNCAWSPTEIIREGNWNGHNAEHDNYYYERNGGGEKYYNNGQEEENRLLEEEDEREREFRFLQAMHARPSDRNLGGDREYYQCGYNSGENQWQDDFKPCLNANAAYSLYGIYSNSLGSVSGGGCSKATYINTFFTTDGLYSFLKALELDLEDYTSYYGWNDVNEGDYYDNMVGEDGVYGYYGQDASNVTDNKFYGSDKHNYYGADGVDEYGNSNMNMYNMHYYTASDEQDDVEEATDDDLDVDADGDENEGNKNAEEQKGNNNAANNYNNYNNNNDDDGGRKYNPNNYYNYGGRRYYYQRQRYYNNGANGNRRYYGGNGNGNRYNGGGGGNNYNNGRQNNYNNGGGGNNYNGYNNRNNNGMNNYNNGNMNNYNNNRQNNNGNGYNNNRNGNNYNMNNNNNGNGNNYNNNNMNNNNNNMNNNENENPNNENNNADDANADNDNNANAQNAAENENGDGHWYDGAQNWYNGAQNWYNQRVNNNNGGGRRRLQDEEDEAYYNDENEVEEGDAYYNNDDEEEAAQNDGGGAYYNYNNSYYEEEEPSEDGDQVIPFVSGPGTCRNRVKFGYSIGIGCSAYNNGKSFTIDQFDGYFCDAAKYKQTVNSLEKLNHAIYNSGGKCMEIYNRRTGMDYASRLLKHSKSCDPRIYGRHMCPDPYDKLRNCDHLLYLAEHGLHHKLRQSKQQLLFALLFMTLAATITLVSLSIIRDRNDDEKAIELTEKQKTSWWPSRKEMKGEVDDDTTVATNLPPSQLTHQLSNISRMRNTPTDFNDWTATPTNGGGINFVAADDTNDDEDPIGQAYSNISDRSEALETNTDAIFGQIKK